mgnify:CR=1 FL=1
MLRSIAFLAALALLILPGAAGAASSPQIVVSIKPVHSLVAGLMQGVGTPHLLVEGEDTPQSVKLNEAKMKLLADADLVIWVGPELEGFLAEAMQNINCRGSKLEMLSVETFKVLPSRSMEGARDPYLWLDVRNAEVFVDVFHDALKAVDPEHAEIYARNRLRMKAEVAQLDREFEYGFRSIAAGEGWAYHDTQQYFSQSYALQINDFLTKVPGQEADMAKLLTIRNQMAEKGKSCLFVEAGMTRSKLEIMTGLKGLRVAELDSFATRFAPGPKLYEQMMRHNFKVISDCFQAIGAVYTGPKVLAKKPKL